MWRRSRCHAEALRVAFLLRFMGNHHGLSIMQLPVPLRRTKNHREHKGRKGKKDAKNAGDAHYLEASSIGPVY